MSVPTKILVFLTGSLGDTLAAVPALWAVRQHWPRADVALLADAQTGRSLVSPKMILAGAGVVDRFLEYPTRPGRRSCKEWLQSAAALWRHLRREKPDVLVYLVRAFASDPRVRRDLTFFRVAGIRRVLGAARLFTPPPRAADGRLPRLPHFADLHLQQLGADGLPVPAAGHGRMDLGLGAADHAAVAAWSAGWPADGGRPWVAFGVGSKMPAKVWPADRYAEVGRRLVAEHQIWPVLFGGPEDRVVGLQFVAALGCGFVAAGALGVRASAAALARCGLYIGNDTGTMHLAAAAGVRCAAVFSARDYPGLWEPYGPGHVVFRREVPCAGCLEESCPVPDHPCLRQIGVEEVAAACRRLLAEPAGAAPAPLMVNRAAG